jgi:hypothetical protein
MLIIVLSSAALRLPAQTAAPPPVIARAYAAIRMPAAIRSCPGRFGIE